MSTGTLISTGSAGGCVVLEVLDEEEDFGSGLRELAGAAGVVFGSGTFAAVDRDIVDRRSAGAALPFIRGAGFAGEADCVWAGAGEPAADSATS